MKITKRVKPLKELRKEKYVPGVIYGKDIDSTPIKVQYLDLQKTFRQYGKNMTFEINFDGEKHIVYIKDVQNDYMKSDKLVHFDLQKVSSEDTITSYVPLHLIGRDDRRKIGFVLTINLDEVEVEYQVGSGVSSIDVDLTGLGENESLHVSDIQLPDGITMLTDPEEVVASLVYVAEVEEPEEEEEVLEVESIKQGSADEEEKTEE